MCLDCYHAAELDAPSDTGSIIDRRKQCMTINAILAMYDVRILLVVLPLIQAVNYIDPGLNDILGF